ncbi:unnamed protein product [Closterium sp. NIES-64]|nr:unnamed protein product [Closterium sp. NIES-64]
MKQRRGSGELLQQRRRRQSGRKHAHLRDNLPLFALFLCAPVTHPSLPRDPYLAVVVSLWHVDNAFHALNNNLLPAMLHLLEMGALPPRMPVPPRTDSASDRPSAAGESSGEGGSDSWNRSSSGSGREGGFITGATYSDARSSGSARSRKGLTGRRGSSSFAASTDRFLQRVQERLVETMERHTSSGAGRERSHGGGSVGGFHSVGQDRGVSGLGLLEGREGAEWGQGEEEGLRVCMLFYLGDERLNQYPTSAVAILWRLFHCRIRLSDTHGLSRRICFHHLAYGQRAAFPFYNSSSSLPGFDQFPAVIAAYRSLAFSLFNIFPAARAVVLGPHSQSEASDGAPRRTLELPAVGPLTAESGNFAVQGPDSASAWIKGRRAASAGRVEGSSGSDESSAVADVGGLGGPHMSDLQRRRQQQQQQQQQHHASLPVPGIYSSGPIVVYVPRSSAFGDDRYVTFINPWIEAMGLTNALYMSPGRLLVEWQDEFALGTGGKDRELLFYWVAKHSGLGYLVEDVRPLHVTGHGIVMNREWATRSAARIAEEWRTQMLDT